MRVVARIDDDGLRLDGLEHDGSFRSGCFTIAVVIYANQ